MTAIPSSAALTSAARPSDTAARASDTAEMTLADDIAVAASQARAAMVNIARGTLVILMALVALVIVSAAGLPPVLGVIGVAAIGAVAATVALWMMQSGLRRVDRLGSLAVALSDSFDRARLDAIRDPLTGLGNHRAFQEELDRSAAMASRHGQSTALLLIDIDDLKQVNDVDGHAVGDEILRTLSRVIAMNSRRIDRAFRIGGDEFAILAPSVSLEEARTLGRRILAMALDKHAGLRPISVTIGISVLPDPSPDRALVVQHAAAALYWGKRHGRTDVQAYDPKLHGMAEDARPFDELAAAIDRVVARRLLSPVYQPVFSLASGVCVGFEGLVRPGDEAAFRNPTELFVAAETVNRTVEVDLAAVRAIAAGAGSLDGEQYLAINLSPRTVEAAAFNPHEVLGILARGGIDSHRVVIELTEREAIEDMDRLRHNLESFRRAGARIAADDVGAGNAGLQLLSNVEFDVIKIDLSLIQTGAVLAPSQALLRALIDMAARRGATTVAEGIETPVQLETVRMLGIDVGQGYLLGRPAPQLAGAPIDIDVLMPPIDPELEQDPATAA